MRCAVVGTGWSGRRLMSAVVATDGLALDAVVSRGSTWDARATGVPNRPFAEILVDERISAVLICTPPAMHVALARAAIDAGKHVVVEKPVGLDADAAADLATAAAVAGVVAAVPYHFRYVPSYQRLAALARGGRFGRLRQAYHRMYVSRAREADWLHDQSASGGVVYETLVHGIDLMRWVLGDPVAVTCRGGWTAAGVVDRATIVLEYAGGALCTLEGSWLLDGELPFGSVEVIGDRGYGHIDRGTFDARHYRMRAGWRDETGEHRIDDVVPDDDVGFQRLLDAFRGAVRGGDLGAVDLRSSATNSRIAETALESACTRRTVEVQYGENHSSGTITPNPGADDGYSHPSRTSNPPVIEESASVTRAK